MALKCLRNPSEAMAPHEECLRILKELKDSIIRIPFMQGGLRIPWELKDPI